LLNQVIIRGAHPLYLYLIAPCFLGLFTRLNILEMSLLDAELDLLYTIVLPPQKGFETAT